MSESLPVNAAEIAKVKTMIVEMTNCLNRIDAEREQMKDIASSVEEKFGIKKKIINKIARTMFKHNYADLQSENEHFEFLYEAIAEGKKVEE